ncbi:hypothetical protein K2173_018441 [Erythroxylum novogranatense]|uniref:BHLH domain-containing protein n=1 Tax=Erythroxylum novogranatense TaxID=1862640 RepID=A0AAV8UE04_9ROSI|nr:hypothetical protein K2173_018441 [Erythroxylum novogranatense]
MVTDLRPTLRSLCLNSEWKYAVFWKLKRRARLVLTWEDAYYDNCKRHGTSEGMLPSDSLENIHTSQDLLGLAVAKMSYHVYSLGEGIVGQVAVTGKHQWIFSDKNAMNSFSSFEFSDGWQSQFSAGIKTIIVVAVAPYGVVQLGSFNKVVEDMKLVAHIKDAFLIHQDLSVVNVSSLQKYRMRSSFYPSGLPMKGSALEAFPDTLCYLDRAANKEGPNDQLPMFSELQKQSDDSSYSYSAFEKTTEVINIHDGLDLMGNDQSVSILPLKLNKTSLEHQDQIGFNSISYMGSEVENSAKKLSEGSKKVILEHTNNSIENNIRTCDAMLPREIFKTDFMKLPTELLDYTLCYGVKPDQPDMHMNGLVDIPKSSGISLRKDLEYQTESSHNIASSSFLKFYAGSELHEALGPAFSKKCMYFDFGAEKPEAGDVVEISVGMNESQMTFDSGSENLLDAVVGNICYGGGDVNSEVSVCRSTQSMLTAEKTRDTSIQLKCDMNSTGCSINQFSVEEKMHNCSNSTELCGANSKEFSSACPNTCSERLDRCTEPARNKKKKVRPAENSRPRPRDRQLIQDRIKELRELVPNGSKCSIDSLLERTIKHMLFLESITKHADKVDKCAEMHHKRIDGPFYEQGSSWAVEVGGHLKVSSIVIENLNKNGQMLVEILCDECSYFLEISEAIKSLGVTILKGITELHGEKTWMCFVVEGENNRVMHRMDVLCSLVQVLQPKTTS